MSSHAPDTPATSPRTRRRALRSFGYALRLRCPACGGRPIFVTWSRMCPSCPVCGFRLERGESGYWVGAYFFNLIAVETVFVLFVGGLLLATWPSPPWTALHYGSIILMAITPIACYPFSKTLFLAFDLLVRPPESADFAEPRERAPAPQRTPR